MRDDLEHRFKFHPAVTQEIQDAHANVRKTCRDAAETVLALIPAGNREYELVAGYFEKAMMFANAALARHSAPVIQPSTTKPDKKK